MQRGTDSVLTSRAPTKFKMVGHDHSRPCTHAHDWQGASLARSPSLYDFSAFMICGLVWLAVATLPGDRVYRVKERDHAARIR